MVTFILVIWSFLDYYYLKGIQIKQYLLRFLDRTILLLVAENILHKRIMSIFLNFLFLFGHLAKVRSWKIFSTCSRVEKVCVCVCVCVWERERERQRERQRDRETQRQREGEREKWFSCIWRHVYTSKHGLFNGLDPLGTALRLAKDRFGQLNECYFSDVCIT